MMHRPENNIAAFGEADEGAIACPWRASLTLAWREILGFSRQGSRVVGAIGQPLVFWIFFSAGFDRNFRLDGTVEGQSASFAEYYFPGTLVLILLFTAIFSTISLIEDRREGFLQSVLVAPLPRWSMVLGKVLGGAVLAVIQGGLFLMLAWTLPIEFSFWKLVQIAVLMLLASLGLTSLGFAIAWRMESTQGFHAIMTVFLMPLWLLSGAFFPVPSLAADSTWLQIGLYGIMQANPLTYTVAGMHQLLYDGPLSSALDLPTMATCWLVTVIAAVLMFVAACWTASGFSRSVP